MASVADFAGRTSDLLIFQGTWPSAREQRVEMALALPGTGGLICTGIQKLAQRFLLVLCTKKGTLLYQPDYGTTFMIQAAQGLWRTTADVARAFNGSRLDFTRQMRGVELDTDPEDERFADARLLGVTLGDGNVGLRIALASLAGSTYKFVSPIKVPTR